MLVELFVLSLDFMWKSSGDFNLHNFEVMPQTKQNMRRKRGKSFKQGDDIKRAKPSFSKGIYVLVKIENLWWPGFVLTSESEMVEVGFWNENSLKTKEETFNDEEIYLRP